MGITIHYKMSFNGTEAELKNVIHGLQAQFRKIPEAKVGKIQKIKRASLKGLVDGMQDDKSTFDERMLGFMLFFEHFDNCPYNKAARDYLDHIGGQAALASLPEDLLQEYREISEKAKTSMQRHQDLIVKQGNGLFLPVELDDDCELFRVMLARIGDSHAWHGRDFTKTGHAERFEWCHGTVIKMLKICETAGILDDVDDEAGMWQSVTITH